MVRGMISGVMVLLALVLMATLIWPPGNSVVDHALQRYRYVHFAPDRPDEDATLIVMLHGYGGTAEEMRHRSGMNAVAREVRADVVYVQAEADQTGISHWNAELGLSDRDDRDFLIALIRGLQAEFGFTPERTFLLGESNGAYMAFAIACEAENLLAGVISVIGTMSAATWESCAPADPVPVLMIHGAEDDVITPAELGGEVNIWQTPALLPEVAARWAAWNGATTDMTQAPVAWAMQTDWRTGAGGLATRYLEISELAHDWPRMEYIGISGAAEAWRFMAEVMDEDARPEAGN